MRVLAHINPGPKWYPGKSVYQQGSAVRAHLDFMRGRFDDHSLLIDGPSASGMTGFAIIEVPGLQAARELADRDPGVQEGVLTYDLEEVTAVRSRGAGCVPRRRSSRPFA